MGYVMLLLIDQFEDLKMHLKIAAEWLTVDIVM